VDEMGGTCDKYGAKKGCAGFWWGNLREGSGFEDLDINRRTIFNV
jgi:hypothetical protein